MYDPNQPQAGTEIDAVQMRGQLNGLKDLIDALNVILSAQVDAVNTINFNEPATATANLVGSMLHFSFDIPRGGVGAPGPPFAQALIDAVNTLDPGQAATVSVYFDGTFVRFTFGIPRGNDGTNGANGTNGNDGAMGPPFTNFLVDGVTTLNANEPATVAANFDGNAVRLLFGIPRGLDGQNGMNGNDGNTGPQGPPGEVTNSALSNAISGTSSNTNAVSTLDTPFADPDAETLRQAYNSLVLAARR